ncbi:uncharacterized protein PRCAT00000806001 [Priceomyces carsonii]|uniref:uncharacterized protein n=1 Tax=Priceomyces carsonii TaxID=28549 RepID=UPI002EDAE219|nr:unnamed protein product [Priceomyces carsonii]
MVAFEDELKLLKSQLADFFDKKFIDQLFLLGFNNVVQSKFQTWILSDLNGYCDNGEQKDSPAIEFTTIAFFDSLWADFQYPIIKFFQYHHAAFYNEILDDFNKSQKDKLFKFKVRPVEMRKLNTDFLKLNKQIYQFYLVLLKYLITHFKNPLIPSKVLDYFDFSIPNNAIKISNTNVQANIIYLIHRCLLSLGDLCRHQTFIELAYVEPSISSKNFFKYRSLSNKEKSSLMLPFYSKALQFYEFCILILPALNEPYNRIGMIYNQTDDKFEAVFWFLRSLLTRLSDNKLGLNNLLSVMRKKWFVTNLVDFQRSNLSKKGPLGFNKIDEMHIKLICMIGHLVLDTNKRGPIIVKDVKFSEVEASYYKDIRDFLDELKNDNPSVNVSGSFLVKQLEVLLSFRKCLNESMDAPIDVKSSFNNFSFRIIENLLSSIVSKNVNLLKNTDTLKTLRLLLNWLKEEKSALKSFQSSASAVNKLAKLMNYTVELLDSESRHVIVNFLKSNSRPLREYYFDEDVHLRESSLIKFQFKDFKDDHLFKANNIDILVGDYRCLCKNDVPSFIQLNEEEKQNTSSLVISAKVLNYENKLRIHAILLLGKRLLESVSNYTFIFETGKFVSKSKTPRQIEEGTRRQSKRDDAPYSRKAENRNNPETLARKDVIVSNNTKENNAEKQVIPTSLEEIELYILNHSLELKEHISSDSKDSSVSVTGSDNSNKLSQVVESSVISEAENLGAQQRWHLGHSMESTQSLTAPVLLPQHPYPIRQSYYPQHQLTYNPQMYLPGPQVQQPSSHWDMAHHPPSNTFAVPSPMSHPTSPLVNHGYSQTYQPQHYGPSFPSALQGQGHGQAVFQSINHVQPLYQNEERPISSPSNQ